MWLFGHLQFLERIQKSGRYVTDRVYEEFAVVGIFTADLGSRHAGSFEIVTVKFKLTNGI